MEETCNCGEHTTCKMGDATCVGCNKKCPASEAPAGDMPAPEGEATM